MNYGYASYKEEASEFWIRIIQGRGIQNALASSLYDTLP
jgi:hypothetical protein